MNPSRLLASLTLLLSTAPLSARTIELTDADCTRMAVLAAEAPRLWWAANESSPGVFTTKYSLLLHSKKAFLICFPIDRIPRGQRITNAELLVPVNSVEYGEQRLTIRRILGDWGVGVCHDYRMVRPKKVEWAKPGARGVSSDCAGKATATVRLSEVGSKAVNVTSDVELWYTGASANQGWIMMLEDADARIHLLSPLSTYPNGRGSWKLRITYEPE